MKVIVVVYTYGASQEFLFSDDAGADAAYATIKDAMTKFRAFRNDVEAVTIQDPRLGETTLRIEQLASVCIQDIASGETLQHEYAAWKGRIKATHEKAKSEAAPS